MIDRVAGWLCEAPQHLKPGPAALTLTVDNSCVKISPGSASDPADGSGRCKPSIATITRLAREVPGFLQICVNEKAAPQGFKHHTVAIFSVEIAAVRPILRCICYVCPHCAGELVPEQGEGVDAFHWGSY